MKRDIVIVIDWKFVTALVVLSFIAGYIYG